MWVKTLTGSNGAAGHDLPLGDRARHCWPRCSGMSWTGCRGGRSSSSANLASAAMMLPLLLVHDAGDIWIIYAVAFCYGVSFVVRARRAQRPAQGHASRGRPRGGERVARHHPGGAPDGRPAGRRGAFAMVGGGAVAMANAVDLPASPPRRSPASGSVSPSRDEPRVPSLAGRGGRGRVATSAAPRCCCTPRSRSGWPCW